MVGYRLSETGTAQRPFRIESISKNIWTIEELCWFLTTHPALIDDRLISLDLTRWLTSEFGLLQTVLKMEKAYKADAGMSDFLSPLLADLDYLTPQELRRFTMKLDRMSKVPVAIRLRLKGDALLENHCFGQAIAAYREALALSYGQGKQFEADLHHNSGTASMQLLEYEEACESFAKALRLTGSEEDKETYLTALYLAKPYKRFREDALALHAGENILREIEERVREVRTMPAAPAGSREELSGTLDSLCRAYPTEAGF
ncbi:MAG: hypothetical protein Q4B09_04130 [Lachnospiraceae bacterium]|nr:hypothetical protein [Lachnospiraceae bacterium]